MANDNPFFKSVDHWVIVWIGDLNSQELEDYLDEPGGANYDEPISNFARDLNCWYDHDFIWSEGTDEKVSAGELCKLNGVQPPEFATEIERRAGSAKVSSLLILWNAKQIEGTSHEFAAGRLKCIGCWPQESPLTD
jgi:hypothetical protein